MPSPAKRGRYCNIWSRCIICQKITSENLAQRQDELYRRLVQAFGSLENVAPTHVKYHKTCVRSYTSKRNLKPSLQAKLLRKKYRNRSEKTQTRSNCVFCKEKTFKKERKLHCVSSSDRKQMILMTSTHFMDNEMIYLISNESFVNNALYHSECITKYLLGEKEQKGENIDSTFDHNEAFQKLLESITDGLFVHKRVYSMSYLLERFRSFLPPRNCFKVHNKGNNKITELRTI